MVRKKVIKYQSNYPSAIISLNAITTKKKTKNYYSIKQKQLLLSRRKHVDRRIFLLCLLSLLSILIYQFNMSNFFFFLLSSFFCLSHVLARLAFRCTPIREEGDVTNHPSIRLITNCISSLSSLPVGHRSPSLPVAHRSPSLSLRKREEGMNDKGRGQLKQQ